ncbi:MAG: hypothetical protein ACPG6T_08050, partial [Paracoccaceae bacterium]
IRLPLGGGNIEGSSRLFSHRSTGVIIFKILKRRNYFVAQLMKPRTGLLLLLIGYCHHGFRLFALRFLGACVLATHLRVKRTCPFAALRHSP